jgi:tetratricopeptide (TPR) repeat protein
LKESRLGAHHASIAVTLQRSAALLRDLGVRRRPEAIALLQRSVDIFEKNLAALEAVRAKKREAADAALDAAREMKNKQAVAEAVAAAPAAARRTGEENSLDLLRDPQSGDLLVPMGSNLIDTVRLRREQLADALEELAELQSAQGEFLAAEALLRRSIGAVSCMPAPAHHHHHHHRHHSEALPTDIYDELAAQNAAPPPPTALLQQRPHIRLAATQTNLGLVLRALGREDEARACLIAGLQIIEDRFGEHLHTAELLEHIAAGYDQKVVGVGGNGSDGGKSVHGEPTPSPYDPPAADLRAKAALLRERALEIITDQHPGSLAHAEAQESLAGTYFALKKFEQSKALFQSALRLREHLKLGATSILVRAAAQQQQGTPQAMMVLGEPLTKHELRPIDIGHTVDDVVNRLQRRDVARRAQQQLELSSARNKTGGLVAADPDDDGIDVGDPDPDARDAQETHGDDDDGDDDDYPIVLPGPRVLMEEDILQGYRNLASAEIQQIKVSKREWKKKKRAVAKRRRKLEAMRLADDRKYVRERAQRLMEGREDE